MGDSNDCADRKWVLVVVDSDRQVVTKRLEHGSDDFGAFFDRGKQRHGATLLFQSIMFNA